MSTASSRRSTKEMPWAVADLELRSWPLRDDPRKAWLMILGAVAAGVATAIITGRPALGVLALGVLLLAMWRLLVLTVYEVGPAGIAEHVLRRTRRIAWSAIGRCQPRATGLLLLPDDDAAPIDIVRGLFIPWSGRREQLLSLVGQYAPHTLEAERSEDYPTDQTDAPTADPKSS